MALCTGLYDGGGSVINDEGDVMKEYNMEKETFNKHHEGGFILVTAIILLAILMGLGAAAMFKTNVGVKVSASAADSAKAFAAAQAGLDKTYAYWSQDPYGQAEFKAIAKAAKNGGTTGTHILNNMHANTIADIGTTAAAVDAWVRGSNARVYNLTNARVVETLPANWNVDKYAQVAVWTARFKPSKTGGYPYATPQTTAAACSDCTAVTYALGRSGNAYKLLREYAFISSSTIQAYGAMMNAPKYNNDIDCQAGTPSTTPSTTTPNPLTPPSPIVWWTTSHMIDATQAPGGVAMTSNNGIDPFSKNKYWKAKYGHGTGSSFMNNNRAIDMFVVYDPGKVPGVPDYPEIAGDQMSNIWSTVVKEGRFSNPNTVMDYFSNGNQLFPLNAYREAANRISGFATEKINGYLVVTTGAGLTQEIRDLKTNNAGHGRAGTLNWTELSYNIQHSIPMYGLLRFMIPMRLKSTGGDTVCGRTTDVYQPVYDPLGQGKESPQGKLIVYGGALFDFYIDSNNDGIYQPSAERLLTRDEASASKKVNVDNPLMFNPVMDAMQPRTGAAACTDILNVSCYPNGSPSWDIYTDAFNYTGAPNVNANGDLISNADGVMDLIYDVDYVARNWSSEVKANGGAWGTIQNTGGFRNWMRQESPAVIISTATSGTHSWSINDKNRMHTLLDYYIKTTALASKNQWLDKNINAIEGDYNGFYIDTGNDLLAAKPSAADLYHAFLPSGYIHGWKRGLEVTGLYKQSGTTGKPIWNVDLISNDPTNPNATVESDTFFISGVDATARIDQDFKDIPAEMYAGGLVDMHHAVNTSGVVYTPDMLELEQKDKGNQVTTNGNNGGGGKQAALQYINGIIISGGGVYMKDETAGTNARTVIAYDDTSIDNLPTNNGTLELGRKYWQELK
jgi:hypothetical protein